MEKRSAIAGAVILLGLAVGQTWGEAKPKIVLGFDDMQPVAFFQVKAGITVGLKGITYNEVGYVAAYDLEISGGFGTLQIKFKTDPMLEPSEPGAYFYKAEVDGKETKSPPLEQWAKDGAIGLLGFAPRGLGGAILLTEGALEADFTTGLAYDDLGRRMISTQGFQYEGIAYEIAYSGYGFDNFGRITAYTAAIGPGK